MGDRALIQIVNIKGLRRSPALYLHWGGSDAPKLISDFVSHFVAKRGGDVEYGFARLVGRAHNLTGGDAEVLSLGVLPVDKLLTKEDSHGGAGVFVIDLTSYPDHTVVHYGGGYAPDVTNLDPSIRWVPLP